ncbi:MAG: DUF1847 domain-containing protein, partial [Campylobacteraceae bacterium]
MREEKTLSCAECGTLNCRHQTSKFPKFCLTTNADKDMLNDSLDHYKNNPEDKKTLLAAAEVEGEFYGKITRVEEMIHFA